MTRAVHSYEMGSPYSSYNVTSSGAIIPGVDVIHSNIGGVGTAHLESTDTNSAVGNSAPSSPDNIAVSTTEVNVSNDADSSTANFGGNHQGDDVVTSNNGEFIVNNGYGIHSTVVDRSRHSDGSSRHQSESERQRQRELQNEDRRRRQELANEARDARRQQRERRRQKRIEAEARRRANRNRPQLSHEFIMREQLADWFERIKNQP